MYAIEVENVSKTYKNNVQALNKLSLKVMAGEVYSLLGENGAGKSTLIDILTTFLKPTNGNISILGKEINTNTTFIRSNISCVSQQISIDTYLSLPENMMFQANLYKVPKEEAKKRMEKLINEFELKSFLNYPVSSYSGGIKRRLDIAMNMMSNPKILFLDEPTVGMDVQSRKAMWKMIKKIQNEFNTTIFLTTHYLEEADSLSDTICIMQNGQKVVQGTPFQLKEYLKQDNIKIILFASERIEKVKGILLKDYDVEKLEVKGNSLIIPTKNPTHDLNDFVSFLLEKQIKFKGIEIVEPTLEDVFLRLTKRD